VSGVGERREDSAREDAKGTQRRRTTVEAVLVVAGFALVAVALGATQSWLDQHFLPSFFLPRVWYVRIETTVRAALGAAGLLLAVVARSRVASIAAQAWGTVLGAAAAAALALAVSELALERVHLRPTNWLVADEEPRRQPDARLGWVLTPARVGRSVVGGRTIEYAIDAAGYRVRSKDEVVDPDRPAIVFAGESVMFGEGLAWDETIPAQTGAMLRVQSANIAVHGYSTDQTYERVARELPRFRRPTAVVVLFMTALFGRNLDDDRPHLDPELRWHPAEESPRLMALAALLVPYRTTRTVELGVRTTRAVLRATVELARARGARSLIVMPQFGPEDDADRALRRRVVDEDLPQVMVTLDAGWRLPWDRHPNAHAAREIAAAIAARLGGG
jgi:hypothetical protein